MVLHEVVQFGAFAPLPGPKQPQRPPSKNPIVVPSALCVRPLRALRDMDLRPATNLRPPRPLRALAAFGRPPTTGGDHVGPHLHAEP